MLLDLSIELLHKICLYSDNIYNFILTNKFIYTFKLHLYLIPYKFKNHYVCYSDNLFSLKEFIYELYNENNYSLKEYLYDLKNICDKLNYYYYRQRKYYLINKFINTKTVRFNYYEKDLYKKKDIIISKIHPVYRINYRTYELLKNKHLNILALIY